MDNASKLSFAKKAASWAIAVGGLVYAAFALVSFNNERRDGTCTDVVVVIEDSTQTNFLDEEDIIDLKVDKDHSISELRGLPLADINTSDLERLLQRNLKPLKNAECFITPQGALQINIWQKRPVLRVAGPWGGYYVDADGEIIPSAKLRGPAYVTTASGYISKAQFKNPSQSRLHKFALLVDDDEFWKAQIEQVFITSSQDAILVPRVGGQTILLGRLDSVEVKLDHLRQLYTKGFNKRGWDWYRQIDMRFRNQAVCSRKD